MDNIKLLIDETPILTEMQFINNHKNTLKLNPDQINQWLNSYASSINNQLIKNSLVPVLGRHSKDLLIIKQ